ncbi:MAG: hypothetical protein AAGA87_18120 [Pseudomonadota bacterium]
MATTIRNLAPRVGVLLRTGAVALIAGVCRWRSIRDVNSSVSARPVREQAVITAAVFAALFALCLAAAQFGWIGILVFWLGVIVLVN